MIAAALALIVLGVVMLFVVPMIGIVAGILGVVLLVLFLANLARGGTRATDPRA